MNELDPPLENLQAPANEAPPEPTPEEQAWKTSNHYQKWKLAVVLKSFQMVAQL